MRLARPDVAGIVRLTVSWFQAVCRSRSACSPGAGGGLVLRAGRRAPSAARDRWIGWRREEQFRRLPGTTRGLLFLVVVSGPLLRCRGWCGGDREAAVACCGEVCLADEVQRHHVQGGEPGVRWQEPCARQRAPTGEAKDPYVFPLRRDAGSFAASCGVGVAGAAGRRRSCARFISGAFRRAQGHRIASVLCVILLACEPARLRRRTTTQKELEQRGRTGTSRSPPCTGCCRTPTRDGSRTRRAAAGRQRGRRQAHRRGSLRDGLAGRYSILNCHGGEIAAVHAATAPAVCSPSTRSTPPARLIVETHRAD